MSRGRATERTFYTPIIDIIRGAGGSAVQEVTYNSVPDIRFKLRGRPWLLSVKIGEDSRTIKDAFLQYLRHKEESRIQFGMVIFLPVSVRESDAEEQAARNTIKNTPATALIDAGFVKQELRGRPFPWIIRFLIKEILIRLDQQIHSYYNLSTVISLLQQQVSDMMAQIDLKETTILRIITHPRLLTNLAHIKQQQTEPVARFLASYILMSQILFLRLLFAERTDIATEPLSPISHSKLRRAFRRICDINYKPIFEVDVLDDIPAEFLTDTFNLIWGLEIEYVRHELPGRIFHELMPREIRKMLAAFYTRPLAAEILSQLTICRSEDTVFDPACGSGTILVSAYKHKRELFSSEGKTGNPHKRFCEEEIFGADIMPFAVHLTSANLAAIDVRTTIGRTQVIQVDSLKLGPGGVYHGGINLDLFQRTTATAMTTRGEDYDVQLVPVDAILMNPPFTKIERGIRDFVNMKAFIKVCGGEVGLWGHFIPLADSFLREKGMFGAVIPINTLRGRESEKVRSTLFKKWTPLYVIKPVRNYGFSEWSEYRDILFIASKKRPKRSHKVKFCLVKKDLTHLTQEAVSPIVRKIKTRSSLKSSDLDIKSYSLPEIDERFPNLMWFCGVTDFRHREIIIDFVNKFLTILGKFPNGYFREGYRPVPAEVSSFLFLTRQSSEARIRKAFLRFSTENRSFIIAQSPLRASYRIERSALTQTLRTPICLSKMNISDDLDYIAHEPYAELRRVLQASGFRRGRRFEWGNFWSNIKKELDHKKTQLVVVHRINPYSPSTHLPAFFSETTFSPSNQMNIVVEPNPQRAQAICALFNSVLFLAQFFLLKEESTGRFINIRFYDLCQMDLNPKDKYVSSLDSVFRKYQSVEFPPLRRQFDENFEERYNEFWVRQSGKDWQQKIWPMHDQPIKPSPVRLKFDLAVCKALGVKISSKQLITLYDVFVKEMIITRHLTRD